MYPKSLTVAAFGLLAFAGCTHAASKEKPEMVQAGEPVTCIQTQNIRSTDVIDDKTIDFKMNGGVTYRNTLPYSCSGLGFEKSFAYKTSVARLCNVDTITVLYTGGGPRRGATCGLGEFVPVKPAEKPAETPASE
ncbi:MAG: DUF6491 family protein [Sphingomonadaceae bacterium]